MGSEAPPLPKWASKPCIMGIDEAGRGPVLGPMVYGCLYCPLSYQKALSTLNFADSKTLKEEKREELFENLKADESIGWAVDVIDPRELSKINLNEISHDSAIGLINKVLSIGVLLTEVYLDTVGDAEKYRLKLSERFPNIMFVVSKKADSLYPVVSGASIVAKVTRDRALRDWALDETAEDLHRNFGSGYPADPHTKAWLEDHKHPVFGFPTLVRFSWGTCTSYSKDFVDVLWESDDPDEAGNGKSSKKQMKLTSVGFTTLKRKTEDIESSDYYKNCIMTQQKDQLPIHQRSLAANPSKAQTEEKQKTTKNYFLFPQPNFSSNNEEQLNTPAIAHATRSDEGGQRSRRHKSFSIFATHHRREVLALSEPSPTSPSIRDLLHVRLLPLVVGRPPP
ncbi:ribonuclease [Striga asiatica]|uniref:Ribonuclease n=1 Tax=Striga asiatica TaxID=4170 RepID=A0A5A7R0F8_STRAF|nr:ribonuclease [Striga asiatica]